MKHICYLDVENYCGEAVSVGVPNVSDPETTIIPTGTTIRVMDSHEKLEYIGLYEKLARDFDINFIFDDAIPEIRFYAVPQVDIFAIDSFGGYWATIGGTTDIGNEKAPICFIDNEHHVFLISESFRNFIYPLDNIGERIEKKILIDNITFYDSKDDAKKAINSHNDWMIDITKTDEKTNCKLI